MPAANRRPPADLVDEANRERDQAISDEAEAAALLAEVEEQRAALLAEVADLRQQLGDLRQHLDDLRALKAEEARAWRRIVAEGRKVIGYAGISQRFNVPEQTARMWQADRLRHIREEGEARPTDMPAPIFAPLISSRGGAMALFDDDDNVEWGILTERLHPDGVTAQRARQHRGPTRKRD